MRKLPFALASLLLVACSAASSDNAPHGTEDAIEAASICTPESRKLTKPNREQYLVFDTHEAAIAHAEGFLASIGRKPPVTAHDARYARAEDLVAEIYQAFTVLWPEQTAGMTTTPRIVIVDDKEELNAFAGFDDRPEVARFPWVLYIHASAFEGVVPDVQLEGLFAHELAHLLLKNVTTDAKKALRRHYAIGAKETLGAIQRDDPALRNAAERWEELGRFAGEIRIPQMNGVPAAIGIEGEPRYLLLMREMFKLYAATSPRAETCTAAKASAQAYQAILSPLLDANDYRVVDDPAAAAKLDAATKKFIGELTACFAHVKTSMFQVVVESTLARIPDPAQRAALEKQIRENPDAARAELQPDDEERKLDVAREGTNVAETLLLASKTKLDALARLEATAPVAWDKLRIFTEEEEADDAATRVMLHLGKDPQAGAAFNFARIPAYADACKRSIATGNVPPYGGILDAHHGTCWRYWHSGELAKALKSCKR